MLKEHLKHIRYKRLIMYDQALDTYGISTEKRMGLYEHIFNLSEIQILRILKNHSLDDFKHIDMPLFHILDMKLIDSYVQYVVKAGREQLKAKNTKKKADVYDGQLKLEF